MSVSPELLHLREMNEMEAKAAMQKVKVIIGFQEQYGREHHTQTMMKIFKIVNAYFEEVMTETQIACDEAMDENLAELNSRQQQQSAASAAESSSSTAPRIEDSWD